MRTYERGQKLKVVVAPDAFKGSISAAGAARALAAGWTRRRAEDELLLRPMADGGEGTLDAFCAAIEGAQRIPLTVVGPDDALHRASFVRLPAAPNSGYTTAVVELATTSGIELLGELRLPWTAHTLGLGQAIAAAIDAGAHDLIVGIGSSASIDGGTGLLSACGARFLDSDGVEVAPGARGLMSVHTADLSGLRSPPPGGIRALADVDNPLIGPRGAAAMFGSQKGLLPSDVDKVDGALSRLAAILGIDPYRTGTGAAGGVGLALAAWGATLASGAVEIGDLGALPSAVAHADVVITGEGLYDAQSAAGKVPAYIAGLAEAADVPAVLIAGGYAPESDTGRFAVAYSLSELAGNTRLAMEDPAYWLAAAGDEIAGRFAP